MTENLPIISETHDGYVPVVKHDSVLQPLELENIGALQDAEVAPFDLMSDYWSPEMKGESRRVLFDRIQTMTTVDQVSGEVIDLECAFFFYQETPGGPIKQIRNGSKRLVGAIQGFNVPRLTPLLIKYLGKVKNKNNANQSDNWSITTLRVNVASK